MRGDRRQNLNYLWGTTVIEETVVSKGAKKTCDTSILWHIRLGHVGEKSLHSLTKKGGLDDVISKNIDVCKYCILGK